MKEAALALLALYITGSTLSKSLWGGTIVGLTGYLNIYTIGFAAVFCLIALQRARSARRELYGFLVVLVTFGSIVIMVAGRQVEARHQQPLPNNANDGIVQSVEAAKLLLRGQNPYTADFGRTAFSVFPAASWDGSTDRPQPRNLAFDHYVYLPLIFLIQAPLVLLSTVTGLSVDYQTLPLIFFLASLALLLLVSPSWSQRTTMLFLTIGTPFIWVYALGGYSEFIVLLPLVAAFIAVDRNKPIMGSIFFGLALATKQTAWLLLPLWLYWLWRRNRAAKNSSATWRQAAVAMGAAGILILPFFLWNPGAMYDDTIRYLSGTIPMSYPISNVTLAQYLVIFGIVKSHWSPISLWPLQLVAYVVTSWCLYAGLKKKITMSRVFSAATAITLAATITNRVGADNYFMVPLLLSIFSFAYYAREQAEANKEKAI